jgi:hypothetical protein
MLGRTPSIYRLSLYTPARITIILSQTKQKIFPSIKHPASIAFKKMNLALLTPEG